MMINDIYSQLRRDEGEVLYVYKDHLGFDTIGVGRLVDRRKGGGISTSESSFLLENDVQTRKVSLNSALPWMKNLDEVRQGVLINMSFQMGVEGLLGFKNTLEMVKQGRYEDAGRGMLNSLWAKQTPARAMRLAEQMRTGVWK